MLPLDSTLELHRLVQPDFFTVSTDTPVAKVRALMEGAGLRHCLVLQGCDVYGVVSDRDLTRAPSPEAPVVEVARNVKAPLRPDHPVQLAIECMAAAGVSAIPVVESEIVVGLVFLSDCMRALAAGVQAAAETSAPPADPPPAEPPPSEPRPEARRSGALGRWVASVAAAATLALAAWTRPPLLPVSAPRR